MALRGITCLLFPLTLQPPIDPVHGLLRTLFSSATFYLSEVTHSHIPTGEDEDFQMPPLFRLSPSPPEGLSHACQSSQIMP